MTWNCMKKMLPLFVCSIACLLGTTLNGFSQVKLDSTNLAIIKIQTGGRTIVDDPRIVAQMQIIHDETRPYNHIEDSPNIYNGIIKIEIRGSSSQDAYPRKSYGLKTIDLQGNDLNVSLLGMPDEHDWILYGPYADKSLMRNVLSYKVGRSLGNWASRTRFCELLINEEYQGVYVLMEKIKRDLNRVDISRLNPDEISGDDLTGGYIIKIDKTTGSGGSGWRGVFGDFFQYEYPEAEDIAPKQQDYIETYIEKFEEALKSPDYQNLETGYKAYIDVNSFVDVLIMSELSKNVDAYRLSTFMYKDKDSRGGKLHMGPIWDYNFTFGNVNYCTGSELSGWVLNFNSICPRDFFKITPWWDRLLSDPDFVSQLVDRWFTLRQGPLHTDSLLHDVDEMEALLSEAQTRNFAKWDILGEGIWPNEFIGEDYESEIAYLKNWIAGRVEWIDQHIEDIQREVSGPFSHFAFSLGPIPMQDRLIFRYRLLEVGEITLEIRNLDGRLIWVQSEPAPGGFDMTMNWDGENFSNTKLPAGLYMYRILLNGRVIEMGKLLKT